MSEPIAKYWVKGTDKETNTPRRSFNWVRSKRAKLKIFEDRAECGNWVIPFEDVQETTLYTSKTLFLINVYVLQLLTKERTYQFGLNPWANIEEKLPVPFKKEKIKLGTSKFSLAIRIILIAYLFYYFIYPNLIN